MQAYILSAALNSSIVSKAVTDELSRRNQIFSDMDRQLRGIATNVNQLAHVANGTGTLPSINELDEINRKIAGFRKEVNDEWRLTRQSINQQKLMEQ